MEKLLDIAVSWHSKKGSVAYSKLPHRFFPVLTDLIFTIKINDFLYVFRSSVTIQPKSWWKPRLKSSLC